MATWHCVELKLGYFSWVNVGVIAAVPYLGTDNKDMANSSE